MGTDLCLLRCWLVPRALQWPQVKNIFFTSKAILKGGIVFAYVTNPFWGEIEKYLKLRFHLVKLTTCVLFCDDCTDSADKVSFVSSPNTDDMKLLNQAIPSSADWLIAAANSSSSFSSGLAVVSLVLLLLQNFYD